MTDTSPPVPPRAFLSHASEDKDTFTTPLARRLAQLGVDPWLDKWEIRPGDSLVQRLFNEGLAHADAVVVVISRFSVGKQWVREELDNATVRRIEAGTRLIPVRLDDAEVPAPLLHLVWITATRGTGGAHEAAQQIADVLHERTLKPAIGPAPAYTQQEHDIPGLNAADQFLLTLVIKAAIRLERSQILDWTEIDRQAQEAGIQGTNLLESIHALAEIDYIDVQLRHDRVWQADLTRLGYEMGIRAVLPEFDAGRKRIISELINDPPIGTRVIHEMAERAEVPVLVVRQLFDELQDRGRLSYTLTLGDHSRLHGVSPTIRREI